MAVLVCRIVGIVVAVGGLRSAATLPNSVVNDKNLRLEVIKMQDLAKQAIVVALKADIPALVWGAPGVGKSRFVEKLGRALGFTETFTVIGALSDPADLRGLPYLVEGMEEMRFKRPYFLVRAANEPCLLFLDEITAAPPTVWAALLRLILERAVDDFKLHPQTRIIGAGNPPEVTGLGFELTAPMANRFVHLQFGKPAPKALGHYFRFRLNDFPEDNAIIERAREIWDEPLDEYIQKWGSIVGTFLENVNPSLIHQMPKEGAEFPDCYAYPTPRSWEFAVRLLAAADLYAGIAPTKVGGELTELHSVILTGCVGSGASSAFVNWVTNLDVPDPLAVLQGRAPLPAREDAQLLVISNISQIYRDAAQRKDEKIFKLVADFAVKLWKMKRNDLTILLLSYMNEIGFNVREEWALFRIFTAKPKPPFVSDDFIKLLEYVGDLVVKWNK